MCVAVGQNGVAATIFISGDEALQIVHRVNVEAVILLIWRR